VATSSREAVVLWDLTKQRTRGDAFPGHVLSAAVALSPDGQRLAVATLDYRVKVWEKVWDRASRRARWLLDEHRGRITALAFSPDGRLLVSGSQDQTVRLWKVEWEGSKEAQGSQPLGLPFGPRFITPPAPLGSAPPRPGRSPPPS
jgi:WD40 repeat protein